MRLINADALRQVLEVYSEKDSLGHTPVQLCDAMPTVDVEPKWIPCKDRLPEYDGERYLVTDYCEQINRRRIHISYCYVNREGFWSYVPIGYKVIAWMPLPKPYEPKEQSDG